MEVTKEDFLRAFERNNQFVQAEKRRNNIYKERYKIYIANGLKKDSCAKENKRKR